MTGFEIIGLAALAAFVTKGRQTGETTANVSGLEVTGGVQQPLLDLLEAWSYQGTHNVHVAGSQSNEPIPGGLRYGAEGEAAQELAYSQGNSKAATLADTPHGRGAALDIYPDGFNYYQKFDDQPDMLEKMRTFGKFAETFGFTWGGRWSKPDHPHVEMPNWRNLPYPPTGV